MLFRSDKEIDYLSIFLGIDIDFNKSLNIEKDVIETLCKDTKAEDMPNELNHPLPKISRETTETVDSILTDHSIPLSFTFRSIPDSYRDFYNSSIFTPCSLCHKRNQLLMCLLCGDKFCMRACDQKLSSENTSYIGNGNAHAFKYHNGVAAFIHCDDAFLVLYEDKRVYATSSLYKDSLGRSVKISKMPVEKMENYKLDKPYLEKFRSLIEKCNVAEFIVSMGLTEDKIHQRSYF